MKNFTQAFVALAALAWATLPVSSAGAVVESDVCVYGGTSGGVIAAVQAARMGKSVVLVEPGRHIGGMTSGGLGLTDTGNTATIGGLAREFYRRVGQRYGATEAFTFEPHEAEQVFRDLLAEVEAPIYFEQRIAGVARTGLRITALTTERGDQFRAKMFLDTTYEGDLLAMAGVSFTFGRESTNAHGESLNGIRASTPSHQFVVAVDPYVVAGNPGSGLLPLAQPGDGGTPGDGDLSAQAYNFRLCLTQVATNRFPIAPPAGYDAARYELLGRYVAARAAAGHSLTLGSFLKIDAMPNGKTDINNNGAISTDYIGMNYTYPTNSAAERARLWQGHEDYIRGLLTFLATDSRVPLTVRTTMQSYGLCRDEFPDTGGWPHQLYVREARRMASDYVMTQANCDGLRVAADSVALASYNMDSHNCQRFVKAGAVINEGDVQRAPAGPFPIAYRSLVPRAGECENLLATFCLSGTHIAFSSCRMEPVFMMTSQSAAAAACLAVDDNHAVQDVPYGKLRLQLLADRQMLEWNTGTATPTNGILLDCEQPTGVTLTGAWTASSSVGGYLGTNYLHDGNTGKGTKSVRFTPTLPAAGDYTVSLRWTTNPNRATNVPVAITYAGSVKHFTVNQQANNGVWVPLATLPFAAGAAGNLLLTTAGTDGYVIADAAMWTPVSTSSVPTLEVIASDGSASEDGPNPAVFTFVRSGDSASAVTVRYAAGGTATPGVDFPAMGGSITIPAGQAAATLTLLPLPDDLPEGDETISLTLLPDASYQPGTYTNASVVLHDGGFGRWRGSQFTPGELAIPAISGPGADPDGDGRVNLLEFFLGTQAKATDAAPGLQLVHHVGDWALLWQRAPEAAGLFLRVETSSDLAHWAFAPFASQTPWVSNVSPLQELLFPIGAPPPGAGAASYRVAVSQTPLLLTTNPARCFFSFDTRPDGAGLFTVNVTASDGFPGTSAVSRAGTVLSEAGGAGSFTDFTGTTWLGSGGATTPGHSLTFNPGSTGNQFSLTFSTVGLRRVRVRLDLRSAAQAGGSAPTAFTGFTYAIGGGPWAVPGVDLSFPGDNVFHEWTADLSAVSALDNQPAVTLTWTFRDLAANPSESFRVDNFQLTAEPMGN